jgi:two-component system chemotaxis sensor kinase CheA
MNPISDTTAEELEIFLEETEAQLQLIDTNIMRLRAEGNNAYVIQKTIRAAHNLKGSSAMIGHQRIYKTADSVERSLDGLRKETLTADQQQLDKLKENLETLRTFREELVIYSY